MSESPLARSAYEVLGVSVTATHEEIRRAYRRLARETHPDMGGSAERFNAVQMAWEDLGDPRRRAAYDGARAGSPASAPEEHVWSAGATSHRAQRDTRPRARSYGHPGGWSRERFTTLMREWVGRGEDVPDLYDPALVGRAPREIRQALADALAEEATSRALSELGMGFTVWHGVATARGNDAWVTDAAAAVSDAAKIDHVVLGPTGLFAVQSEDWGAPARVRRGDLVSDGLATGERPMHALGIRAKALSRRVRAKFTGLVIVLPDDALEDAITALGRVRGAETFAVRRSVVAHMLRTGVPGAPRFGGNELFEIRTRLQQGVEFV